MYSCITRILIDILLRERDVKKTPVIHFVYDNFNKTLARNELQT